MKMDWVLKVKTWIYIIGILGFTAAVMYHCTRAHAIEQECSSGEGDSNETNHNDFWPPDMIPHPTCPGDEPSGPGKPTPCDQ